MWYERMYDRMRSARPMRSKRGLRHFLRDRRVRIASAIGAVAGLVMGLRRWRASRAGTGAF